jgi:hypothetical protein
MQFRLRQSQVGFCLAAVLAAGAAEAAIAPADRGIGPAHEPENYDAKFDSALWDQHFKLTEIQQAVRAQRAAALQTAPRNGFPGEVDSLTATPRVLWAGADRAPAAVAPLASEKAITEARARDFLRRQAGVLGLDAETVSQAELIDAQAPRGDGKGGAKTLPTIARFRQMFNGTEVFNQRLNVAMNANGQLIAITGGFAVDIDRAASSKLTRTVDGAAALAIAFADLGGAANTAFTATGSRSGYQTYRAASVTGDLAPGRDSRLKPVYFALGNQLVPAYYLELSTASRDGHRQLDYGFVVSATDGTVLFRKNQRQYEAFSYRVFADSTGNYQPYDAPLGTSYTPYQGTDIYGAQTRTSATANLITLSTTPMISTADPWLPSGATVTSGNNVNAYLDLSSPDYYQADSSDLQPTVTASGTFDYPITADAEPSGSDAKNAAAVNLFYLNNWEHDFWYDHGFDEVSGNAQASNYGRGGVEGDAIEAQGQDYSGTNNANMSTPADGGSPRMQMYLFDGPATGEVTVTIPPAEATSLAFGIAAFGPTVFEVSGSFALVDDGAAPVTDACTAVVNTSAIAGKIAVIDRGTCTFQSKAAQAEAAGAIGVIIVNNTSGGPPAMAGDTAAPVVNIPTVSVTQTDGETIKTALTASLAVTGTLKREVSTPANLDGTLDNQVISHEFFHYVSNRLVGDGSGLSNNQGGGMGEGWSDFNSMLLTVRPEDISITGNSQYESAYPVGFYVIVPSYYFGIRRTPYSTDFAIDSLTFQHIQNDVELPTTAPIAFGADGASNAEVHNTGEIWTNMLWEGYAALLTSGHYTFDEARSRMQDYVIGGLKLTPNAPTFTEARDGVVAAAESASCVDANLISAAFAKRGIGADAVAPKSRSRDNAGVVEDYTPVVINCPPVADAGPDQSVATGTLVTLDGSGSSDGDGQTLSYEWVQTAGPAMTLSDRMVVQPTFTPPAAGDYVFRLTVKDPTGASSTDSVTVTATGSSGGGDGGGDGGGGAMGVGSLMALLGAAALRRRKRG